MKPGWHTMNIGLHYIPSPLTLLQRVAVRWFGLCNTTFFITALKKITFTFALFSTLIIFIDIMLHIGDVVDKKTKAITWVLYYGCLIAKRFDVLLPFSVGISFVQLLEIYVRRNQFIPLLMTGKSLTQLFRPFLLLTCLFSLSLLLHYQFVLPKALPKLAAIEATDFGRKRADEEFKGIGHVHLANGSKLLFNTYSRSAKTLHQVFLIKSFDEVDYMRELQLLKGAHATNSQVTDPQAIARGVEHFKRVNSKMVLLEPEATVKLNNFTIDPIALRCATAPPKELSLFQLGRLLPHYLTSQSERSVEVQVALFQKLFQPLFILAAFITACCTTLDFSRTSRFFPLLTTAVALMGIQIFLQGFLVLARAAWITPGSALLLPWLSIFILLRYFYRKKTYNL